MNRDELEHLIRASGAITNQYELVIHQGANDEVESAWDAEILRRLDEVDQGTAKLVSAEDAFSQVRRAVG